jgi:hypothetical protein
LAGSLACPERVGLIDQNVLEAPRGILKIRYVAMIILWTHDKQARMVWLQSTQANRFQGRKPMGSAPDVAAAFAV